MKFLAVSSSSLLLPTLVVMSTVAATVGQDMIPLVLPPIHCGNQDEEPCGVCMGDCNTDDDCADGLVCYHKLGRANNDDEATVPGCIGYDYSRTDWCIDESLVHDEKEMTVGDTIRMRSDGGGYFNRIASFLVCSQLDPTCNDDTETVSEIVTSSKDGRTLIYTDSTRGVVGFVDITDPANPIGLGVVNVGGEPTSVATIRNYAIVAVNTSPSFVELDGIYHVIDIATQTVVRTDTLGGQPDSIAVSPDETYIAIAIENERDEDLNDGLLPQYPAGYLVVMETSAEDVDDWTIQNVALTGLDGILYNDDPEPEYVAINEDNICVVTLQENNGIVLVDLPTLTVLNSFTAGSVSLYGVDVVENNLIEQTGSIVNRLREPDAVTWIGTEYFATADEGDLDGGSRTFTIYNTMGDVVYDSGTTLEDWVTRIGHYQEGRSENKGNEPETVLYAEYDNLGKVLFVNSERGGVVFVYEVTNVYEPELIQILPAGVGPEGTLAIPSRNLLIVANEVDERVNKIRSHLSIYEIQDVEQPNYPMIWTDRMFHGNYIPFSAMSGLASDGGTMLYSVEDSFFVSSRVFAIDTTQFPYTVVDTFRIMDTNDVLADTIGGDIILDGDGMMAAILLNDDGTVNLDLEGIDVVDDGFWIVSEGRGTVGDEARPLETYNLLIKLNMDGVIDQVVLLPPEMNDKQVRFGLEGVAVDGNHIVVAIQRAWTGDDHPRLGIYNIENEEWKFVFYPLDTVESQYGGWVGLSDIESLGNGSFLVLERDNQGGPDAAIKKIYQIDLDDYSMEEGTTVEKVLVYDLIPDLLAGGGLVMEKIEGLTMDGNGNVWINNDNDGVDDNSGEQLLFNLGPILEYDC